ncbi:MAG: dockerin type I repeat-containing protein [Ruminococcus sp.]|nr:dockerin type I repeat-containing protein [Ruminococcus sp.]
MMKRNRITAVFAALMMASMPVMNTAAADKKDEKETAKEMIQPASVLADFDRNDVNGAVIVRMPEGITAEAKVYFSSPESGNVAYYNSALEGGEEYSFAIEGRDNTTKDYRHYMLSISFTDPASGSVTSPLDLSFEVPDGVDAPGTYTVYDYTFIIDSEKHDEPFRVVEDAPQHDKIGDVYYPTTFAVGFDALLMGDVNGDGKITAIDASLVLVECAELSEKGVGKLDARKTAAADVDKDGKLTAKDASAILVYCADLSEKGSATWKN